MSTAGTRPAETRRDRIATIIQEGHRDRLTSFEIAARVDALLARETGQAPAPALTFSAARAICYGNNS